MGRPKPPDPMQTARAATGIQPRFHARCGGVWPGRPGHAVGIDQLHGEIGSPDRSQSVTLNPQDQARLDQERSIKSTTS